MKTRAAVSVIVPTLNEELNIRGCLETASGWADEIIVIDAGSSDRTVEIARQYTCNTYTHAFGPHAYAHQKNWALDLPLHNDWVLILDADERVSDELRCSILSCMNTTNEDIVGYSINVQLVFLGKAIKHGLYADNWALRFFHRKKVKFVNVGGLEYAQACGPTGRLNGVIMHCDSKDLSSWTTKQNERSSLEAIDMSVVNNGGDAAPHQWARTERRAQAKSTTWRKLPLIVRPFLLFVYGYVLRLGFLDGREGFIYSFLMSFWYRLLVDAKYIEITRAATTPRGGEDPDFI